MATNKITLNELRSIIRQVIKENEQEYMNNGKGEYTIENLPLLLNKMNVIINSKLEPKNVMFVANSEFLGYGSAAPSFAIYNNDELENWKREAIKQGYKPDTILRVGMGSMWYIKK